MLKKSKKVKIILIIISLICIIIFLNFKYNILSLNTIKLNSIKKNSSLEDKLQAATATPEDVLNGKTYYDENMTLKTGSYNDDVEEGVSLELLASNLSSRYEQTIDLKSLNVSGYQDLTIDNFLIVNKGMTQEGPDKSLEKENINKFNSREYDSTTGILKFYKDKFYHYQNGNTSGGIYVPYYIYDVYITR